MANKSNNQYHADILRCIREKEKMKRRKCKCCGKVIPYQLSICLNCIGGDPDIDMEDKYRRMILLDILDLLGVNKAILKEDEKEENQ